MDNTATHSNGKAYRTGLLLCSCAILVFAVLALSEPAFAQFGLDTAANQTPLGKTETSLPVIIGNIISVALGFVGVIFLLLMLYGGFMWMTARGNTDAVDKAKTAIVNAIIGIVIVASAYAITSFIVTRVAGAGGGAGEAAGPTSSAPSCTVSCSVPLDCGGIAASCGCSTGYSCRCGDGTLSTNGFPCSGAGSCVCSSDV